MQLNVENLTLEYQSYTLFKHLHLRADSGLRLCLAGPSGSGKSSLFRAMLGFMRPSEGAVFIGGTELTEKTVWKLRHHIAYVPQEPELGSMTVRERLEQPFKLRSNVHRTPKPAELAGYWERFGLSDRLLEKPATELSGGEKQRVAVIIALLLKRPVLLLDEPVSAMDKQSRQTLRQILVEQNDKTVLFISHDETLLDIAHQVIDIKSFGGGQ